MRVRRILKIDLEIAEIIQVKVATFNNNTIIVIKKICGWLS